MSSRSQTVIKKGTQGLTSRGKNANETALVPSSTLRALQLRNGKGGAFGTGELMRISGREKLELLAEDEMEKANKESRNLYEARMNSSLKAPFQLETALKISQSQMDAYIDLIDALHNPELCYDIVLREIEAHSPPKKDREESDFKQVPSFVAQQFGICAHNAHMLASGWVILYESFRKLREMGLKNREVHAQLISDTETRDVYLSAYRLLKKLVSALQQRLRSIVQNTAHYAPYFKSSSETEGLQEFENSEIKRMYKSFLDSTIIELCLPGSKFSPQSLYFCLHTTQEETPKLLKRCPQLMWDVVGDLADAVRLLDIMETPLSNRGPTEEDSAVFSEFIRWDEAQAKSVQAAMQYSSFVNLVHPLSNLTDKAALSKAWKRLDRNYVREAGQDIESLWQLVDARQRIPHFSTLSAPAGAPHGKSKRRAKELAISRQNGKRKPKRFGNASDSEDLYADMPELTDISNSEDEGRSDSDDEDSSDDDYDEDDEEELKRQQREAIDRSFEDPDVLDLNNDKYKEERKKNPLLTLLGNLRGRLFSSTAILRTDGETTAPSKPSASSAGRRPSTKPSVVPRPSGEKPATTPTRGTPLKPTAEDADEESDAKVDTTKKKKPKKKKKKKANNINGKSPTPEVPTSPISEPPRSPSPPPESQVTSPVLPPSPKAERQRKARTQSIRSQTSTISETTTFASTTTLPLPHEEKASSAHSYLKKELGETKTKVKTRREAEPEEAKEEEGRSLFDRFRGKNQDIPVKDEKQEDDLSFFGRLKKKTLGNFQKLIGASAQDRKGSLKWEQFVQVMCELGFDYDPSTAGSSVRFDPPNRNVRSITFHKPHPDPTLHQHILKEYRAKLESYYGWSPEVFKKAMDNLGGASND